MVGVGDCRGIPPGCVLKEDDVPEPTATPIPVSRKKAGRPKHPQWPLVSVNVLVPSHDLKVVEALADKYGMLRSELLRAFVRTGIAKADHVGIVVDDGVARVNI